MLLLQNSFIASERTFAAIENPSPCATSPVRQAFLYAKNFLESSLVSTTLRFWIALLTLHRRLQLFSFSKVMSFKVLSNSRGWQSRTNYCFLSMIAHRRISQKLEMGPNLRFFVYFVRFKLKQSSEQTLVLQRF